MTDAEQPVFDVGGDPWLEAFAEQAEESGLRLGITLCVRGTVISGLVVGRDTWLEEFARLGEEAPGEFAGVFTSTIQRALQEAALEQRESAQESRRYHYLHLRDANILQGDTPIPHSGYLLWRGRIAEVSGWSLGTFEPPSA